MIRPSNFGFNHETEKDNSFQNKGHIHPDVAKEARLEFDKLVDEFRKAHIHVTVVEDSKYPLKPDAIFPNNWFSTHADGTVVTYPMYSEIRRLERQNPVLETLKANFQITNFLHLEEFESENLFLEGTGSIVFDHDLKKAFVCSSERSNSELLQKLCDQLGYRPIVFHAYDKNGKPIYHTNVMMSITSKLNIVCLETVPSHEVESLLEEFSAEKELLIVDYNQMTNFCCNILEVSNDRGESHLAMSTRAYQAFDDDQIALIEKYHHIVHSPLTTIENIGGGGCRCMLAQIFLPSKT